MEFAFSSSHIAQRFGKAAHSYTESARLQREVAFDALKLLPAGQGGLLLDLGCGPGWFLHNLVPYGKELIGIDLSAAMLEQANAQGIASACLQADAAALPLADASVQTVFSSLMLQWCETPAAVFAEISRVLKPGGHFVITTLVEESLQEFSHAWLQAGSRAPALPFRDVAGHLQAAREAGLSCHGQQKTYQLFFPDVFSLAREFKQLGASYSGGQSNVAGLAGRRSWQRFAEAYQQKRTTQGLPLSYQVLLMFGHKPAGVTC